MKKLISILALISIFFIGCKKQANTTNGNIQHIGQTTNILTQLSCAPYDSLSTYTINNGIKKSFPIFPIVYVRLNAGDVVQINSLKPTMYISIIEMDTIGNQGSKGPKFNDGRTSLSYTIQSF